MRDQNSIPLEVLAFPIGKQYCALIDPEDLAKIHHLPWHAQIEGDLVYAVAWDKSTRKAVKMHRLIMDAAPGQRIDHRDGDGLHNWKGNLRHATNSENCRNTAVWRTGKALKSKGVTMRNGKFRAQIMHDRKKYQLGTFATESDAARAYDSAALRLFGEFARCNFAPIEGNGPALVP